MNPKKRTRRLRVSVFLAVAVAALGFAGSALAFDCIRVSSSLQGLQQSTQSGKWALFDLSSGASVQLSFAGVGEDLTGAQAACLATAYRASCQPLYFALGFGVAGPNGELAHNNPNESVLSNGRGIDHLEDSGILTAIFAAAAACGIPLD
jgi:hypothetical protein